MQSVDDHFTDRLDRVLVGALENGPQAVCLVAGFALLAPNALTDDQLMAGAIVLCVSYTLRTHTVQRLRT